MQKNKQTLERKKDPMNRNNPKYVLRNYMAQLAIESMKRRLFINKRALSVVSKTVRRTI